MKTIADTYVGMSAALNGFYTGCINVFQFHGGYTT